MIDKMGVIILLLVLALKKYQRTKVKKLLAGEQGKMGCAIEVDNAQLLPGA